jgi:hypothetical protein
MVAISVTVKDKFGQTATATANATVTTTPPSTWPDASNTGVPAGTTLTNYTGPAVVTTNGTLIENKTINGGITVKASNVTIRNCRINQSAWFGVEGQYSPGLRIERCTIVGPGKNGEPNSCILGGDPAGATFIANNLSGVCIGIQTTGTCTIKDNYIHDLAGGQADPHFDGITLFAGQSGTLIEHNNIIVPSDHGTASVLIGTGNNWGPISNTVIRNNRMAGAPSYTIYSNGGTQSNNKVSGTQIIDNLMQRGAYGYLVHENNTVVWTNNRDLISGNLIPAQ